MEVRKIVSKEAEDKKRKKNSLIIGLALIGLMVLSSVGYSFISQDNPTGSSGNKINYNGFEFVNNNGLWTLNLGNFNFIFKHNPKEITPVNSSGLNLLNRYVGNPLYISSESTEAELEIYSNLDSAVLRRQYACLEGRNCTNEQFPIKTCSDNFIIIEKSSTSEIIQDNNCVFIKGPEENLALLTDEFLFKILNIM